MSRLCARLVIAAAIATGALSSASYATPPGTNGRIAFMLKDASGHWQTWIAGRHLEHPKRITSGPADSGWAVWSPDGRRLAFDSSRSDPDPNDATHVNDVFTMNPDGTNVTQLTDTTGVSGDAAWSPDGSLIAFDVDRGDPEHAQGIYLMKPDGTGLEQVTTGPRGYQGDFQPRFSPDGSRLVFARYRGQGATEQAALYVVRLDGSGLRRLTSFALHVGDADWSSDGKRIVFEAYPNGPLGDIYVMGSDGRGLRNLTRDSSGQADPVWAPDGTKVLFLDNRIVNGRGRTGLATMQPDGSGRRFLASKNAESHQPDWESIG